MATSSHGNSQKESSWPVVQAAGLGISHLRRSMSLLSSLRPGLPSDGGRGILLPEFPREGRARAAPKQRLPPISQPALRTAALNFLEGGRWS